MMGPLAIDLAIGAAVLTVVLSSVGFLVRPRRQIARRYGLVFALLAVGFTAAGITSLGRALWRVDPAWEYVARHTSRQTPLPYRIAAVWGGMEGSLLFWAFVVACVFGAGAFRLRSGSDQAQLAVVGVGGISTTVFLIAGRVWASPFERTIAPTGTGEGLLAVLQHPAMVYHPPILYTGLALTGVPYALTLVALARRQLDVAWRGSVIGWLRAAWLVLGAGIVTGSQWAYAELGWGGFWAWDPVENASLLPWLSITIALHLLSGGADMERLSGAVAAIIAYVFVIVGVYVTRSGSTGSIHAFSESPDVGRPLLAFAGVTLIVGVALLVRHGRAPFARPSANLSGALRLHGVLGSGALLAVSLGTFWPVVDGLLFGDGQPRSLIQPQYYHRSLVAIAVAALLAMSVGPFLSAVRGWSMSYSRPVFAAAATIGSVTALAVAILAAGTTDWLDPASFLVLVSAGVALGAAAVYGSTPGPGQTTRVGIALAHGGFALLLLAAVASAGGSDQTVRFQVGETVDLGATGQVTLVALDAGQAQRYEFVRATVAVSSNGSSRRFEPELRAYERQRIPTAESVISGSARGDVIVVLESLSDDLGAGTVTVRTRPLLPWVWVGALMVLLGGALTVRGRRGGSEAEPDGVRDRVAARSR